MPSHVRYLCIIGTIFVSGQVRGVIEGQCSHTAGLWWGASWCRSLRCQEKTYSVHCSQYGRPRVGHQHCTAHNQSTPTFNANQHLSSVHDGVYGKNILLHLNLFLLSKRCICCMPCVVCVLHADPRYACFIASRISRAASASRLQGN